MDTVLVIGASGAIGAALAAELGARGFGVESLSRSADGFDITDAASVEAHLAGRSGYAGVIVATGALEIGPHGPEKSIKAISADAMAAQFALNAIGPALVLRHAPRLLRKDKRAVFAALSARVGSIGDNRLGGWISYRASKAALNQILHTGAIELARTHRQAVVAAIHPGTVRSELTEDYVGRHPAATPPEAARNILNVLDGLKPSQSGGFWDWAGKEVPW
jgi:NAD(P)-dependent dehydrogenase (short-subunit alcohol dehydrogenase family)